MEGYDEATYGERVADVYDEWFGELGDLERCVEGLRALAAHAHAGRDDSRSGAPLVLELGVGTGRVALPLAATGLDVRGVDSSPAMLAALRRKPGGETVAVAVQDMADAAIPDRDGAAPGSRPQADLVFVAYNTFFNLPDNDAQQRCVRRVAGLLAATGRFVIEAFVPDLTDADRSHVTVRSMAADRLVLSATVVDEAAQLLSGQHVEITESGIRLRPWQLHYLTVAELDAMAVDAGLVLDDRWGDFERTPFDAATSAQHVSVYRHR